MLRDKSAAGLAIRVQKGGASWYFITRERKMVIGRLDAFATADIPELRNLVTRARSMLAEGNDPTTMLKAAVVHRSTEAASAQAAATSGSVMRWEAMRDAYLAWAKGHRSPDTYRGYRSALGAIPGSPLEADFKAIAGRPLTLITTHDLRLVRNAVLERGKIDGKQVSNQDQARLTVASLKAAFGWAVENTEVTGLTTNPATELKRAPTASISPYAVDPEETEDKRALTLLELGMLVTGLDKIDNHPARLGVMLQLMTGQRRMTVARARRRSFASHPEYGMIWKVGPDKSGKYRVLPLPDLAASAVEGALAAGRSTDLWLLPQQRLRRSGDAGGSHIAERTLSDVLLTLRAPGGPLSSAPWVATHDLRRAFVTHMLPRTKALGLDSGAVPMITRADEGRYGLDETVYDQDPALPAKSAMLTEWDRVVKEGCMQAERLLDAAG
nr:hypothetical protein [Aureimonas sp. SA4125]